MTNIHYIIAIISKLPTDLEDVRHILPFWFNYLYWFIVIVGLAVVLSLIIYLGSKLIKYLQAQQLSEKFRAKEERERCYTKIELLRDLKIIMNNSLNNEDFRFGLHRMSAVLKMYYEIMLKKEIEEMTASEIKFHVHDRKELGNYFTELTVIQFRIHEPGREDFMGYYNRALKLVR